MAPSSEDVSQLLLEWCGGNEHALERLIPLVYGELHAQAERAMRRERLDHTLQPTALVHETFLKLVDQRRIQWQNRAQFFGVAAQLMRRIVLKYARRHGAMKRGGGAVHLPLDDQLIAVERRAAELIALDEAMERLAALDSRQSRIIEMRYFGGLSIEDTAEVLDISTATVKREARFARAWLQSDLESRNEPVP